MTSRAAVGHVFNGAPVLVDDEPAARGVIRTCLLADQERRNAFTPASLTLLEDVLTDTAQRPDVSCLVIGHTGTVFCAGTDLGALGGSELDEGAVADFLARIVRLVGRTEASEIPVIAALNGPAVGGGFELALACDIRIMSDDAWCRLPEVSLGAVAGAGGAHRLSRLAGRSTALRLGLGADRISAVECASLGLAQRCAPGSALDDAKKLARRLDGHSGTAMRAMKRLVMASETRAPAEMDAEALTAMVRQLQSPDGREGLVAFREKRTARFTAVLDERETPT
jgi:enoyl-CoA hydratase/carnithine racemase